MGQRLLIFVNIIPMIMQQNKNKNKKKETEKPQSPSEFKERAIENIGITK